MIFVRGVCPTDLRLGAMQAGDKKEKTTSNSCHLAGLRRPSASIFRGMSITHSCKPVVYLLCTCTNKLAVRQQKTNSNISSNLYACMKATDTEDIFLEKS